MAFVEVILQTFLAFFSILIFTRILGKQQVGQLTFFEYINGITFGSIAAVLATDPQPQQTLFNFIGLLLFALLTLASGFLSMKSRPLRKVIQGEPTIVIHNGKILENNIRKMRYNIDELLMQLREKDIFDLKEVEFAVLEPNGTLSVAPKSEAKPVTRQDIGIKSDYEGLSVELVINGEIVHKNLKELGLDEQWLTQELKNFGVNNISEVDLAVLSSKGELFIDTSTDNLQTTMDISDTPEPSDTNN